jgi:outer membrane protein assembly factor BamB
MRCTGLAILLSTSFAAAADWPQWLGPTRNALWTETGTLDQFPKEGPKIAWRVPVRNGYSGPAVVAGKVYVMDRKLGDKIPEGRGELGTLPGNERVLCLDAATGKTLWEYEYDCPYSRISYPQGPRTTPVVVGDTVYTLGTMGDMLSLNATTGKLNWQVSFVKDLKVKTPAWGFSAHLLHDAGTLYTLVGGEGGAVRAFDAATGKEKWKALSSTEVGYSPPVLTTVGKDQQLIVWLSDTVAGVNPKTGVVLWKEKHPLLKEGQTQMRPAVTITTPALVPDGVIVSSVYDGALSLKIEGEKATVNWRADGIFPKTPDKIPTLMTSILARGDYLYAVDFAGAVRCAKLKTGEDVWTDASLFEGKEVQFASAFWVQNGEKTFAMTDLGDLVILKLTPEKYTELGRAHILEPTLSTRGRKAVWAHPAFSGKKMFARNDKEMVCVDLAG